LFIPESCPSHQVLAYQIHLYPSGPSRLKFFALDHCNRLILFILAGTKITFPNDSQFSRMFKNP